jgi:Protein of unknown function (DUF1194)
MVMKVKSRVFMGRFYTSIMWFSRGIVALLGLGMMAPLWAAETPVAIELVLALDSSASMNREEFDLQIQGITAAFKDPAILQAIKDLLPLGVAVTVTQWGGPGESRVVVPFTHIVTQRQAKAFGFRASRGTRSFYADTTSIASAIEDSVALLEANGFDGQRRVIDVSGDGVDNSGEDLNAARNVAQTAGVTVNGLAIESEQPGLFDYYEKNVITGADSFAIRAIDFKDYARAIREKLLKELRPLES